MTAVGKKSGLTGYPAYSRPVNRADVIVVRTGISGLVATAVLAGRRAAGQALAA